MRNTFSFNYQQLAQWSPTGWIKQCSSSNLTYALGYVALYTTGTVGVYKIYQWSTSNKDRAEKHNIDTQNNRNNQLDNLDAKVDMQRAKILALRDEARNQEVKIEEVGIKIEDVRVEMAELKMEIENARTKMPEYVKRKIIIFQKQWEEREKKTNEHTTLTQSIIIENNAEHLIENQFHKIKPFKIKLEAIAKGNSEGCVLI